MVAIGRALMSNPRVLLGDEISLGLARSSLRTSYPPFRDPARAPDRRGRAGYRPGAQVAERVIA